MKGIGVFQGSQMDIRGDLWSGGGMRETARKRLLTCVIGGIGVLIIVGAAMISARRGRAPAREDFYAEGGPLDIRLVGVMGDGRDDLYDGDGNKIGERLSCVPTLSSKDTRAREFFFAVPDLKHELLIEWGFRWRPAGENYETEPLWNAARFAAGTNGFEWVNREGISCIYTTPPSGLFQRRKQIEVPKIDIIVPYYYGARAKGVFNFDGSFLKGAEVRAAEDNGARLMSLGDEPDIFQGVAAVFEFRCDKALRSVLPAIAYDRLRRRHVAQTAYWQSEGDTRSKFTFRGVLTRDVAAVVVGEEPHVRIFHNVQVAYPGEEIREYPGYMDEMAERLGCEPQRWRTFDTGHFNDANEAIAVIDVARGWHVRDAAYVIRHAVQYQGFDYASLDEAAKQRVRDAAQRWLGSWYRASAIELGMALGWEGYFEKGLAILKGESARTVTLGPQYLDEENDLIFAVTKARELNTEENTELARAVHTMDNDRYVRRVAGDLVQGDSGAAVLELAEDQRAWVWLPAMRKLVHEDALNSEHLTGMYRSIWVRVILAGGSEIIAKHAGNGVPRDLVQWAEREKIALFLDCDLARKGFDEWDRIHKELCGVEGRREIAAEKRAEMMPLYVEFLEGVNVAAQPEEALGASGCGPDRAVGEVLANINRWYGKKFGTVVEGTPGRIEVCFGNLWELRKAVGEVLDWWQEGAAYRPVEEQQGPGR